jgi:hypothetical protein
LRYGDPSFTSAKSFWFFVNNSTDEIYKLFKKAKTTGNLEVEQADLYQSRTEPNNYLETLPSKANEDLPMFF